MKALYKMIMNSFLFLIFATEAMALSCSFWSRNEGYGCPSLANFEADNAFDAYKKVLARYNLGPCAYRSSWMSCPLPPNTAGISKCEYQITCR